MIYHPVQTKKKGGQEEILAKFYKEILAIDDKNPYLLGDCILVGVNFFQSSFKGGWNYIDEVLIHEESYKLKKKQHWVENSSFFPPIFFLWKPIFSPSYLGTTKSSYREKKRLFLLIDLTIKSNWGKWPYDHQK